MRRILRRGTPAIAKGPAPGGGGVGGEVGEHHLQRLGAIGGVAGEVGYRRLRATSAIDLELADVHAPGGAFLEDVHAHIAGAAGPVPGIVEAAIAPGDGVDGVPVSAVARHVDVKAAGVVVAVLGPLDDDAAHGLDRAEIDDKVSTGAAFYGFRILVAVDGQIPIGPRAGGGLAEGEIGAAGHARPGRIRHHELVGGIGGPVVGFLVVGVAVAVGVGVERVEGLVAIAGRQLTLFAIGQTVVIEVEQRVGRVVVGRVEVGVVVGPDRLVRVAHAVGVVVQILVRLGIRLPDRVHHLEVGVVDEVLREQSNRRAGVVPQDAGPTVHVDVWIVRAARLSARVGIEAVRVDMYRAAVIGHPDAIVTGGLGHGLLDVCPALRLDRLVGPDTGLQAVDRDLRHSVRILDRTELIAVGLRRRRDR